MQIAQVGTTLSNWEIKNKNNNQKGK